MIESKTVFTLDDQKEYIVVSKTNFESKEYYYLVEINNNANIKFGYIDNEEFVETSDNDIISKLLPLFLVSVQKELGIINN